MQFLPLGVVLHCWEYKYPTHFIELTAPNPTVAPLGPTPI